MSRIPVPPHHHSRPHSPAPLAFPTSPERDRAASPAPRPNVHRSTSLASQHTQSAAPANMSSISFSQSGVSDTRKKQSKRDEVCLL